MTDLPAQADIVIVGGGVIGASTAYHLTCLGFRDILVLERNQLSSGATARSAGCISHGRSDRSTIRMLARTRAAIRELEEKLGECLDFRQVGCMRVVMSEEREAELRVMEECLAAENMPVQVLDKKEAVALRPWLSLDKARRIVLLPYDGYIDGARLGAAYGRAARVDGARFLRGVEVTGLLVQDDAVCGVTTSRGTVRARWVVHAGGAWAPQLSMPAGVNLAAAPTRSHYWITAPDGSGPPDRPNVQLPDMRAYLRSEVGGILVGLQEPRSRTFDPLQLAGDMGEMPLEEADYDLQLLLEQGSALAELIPAVNEWQFAHHIVGLSMYTPDGKFILGTPTRVNGLVLAGGCCGSGVAASGGFGQSVAEIIAGITPSVDLALYRPDRFGDIDTLNEAFRERCAAARSGKSRGRADPIAA